MKSTFLIFLLFLLLGGKANVTEFEGQQLLTLEQFFIPSTHVPVNATIVNVSDYSSIANATHHKRKENNIKYCLKQIIKQIVNVDMKINGVLIIISIVILLQVGALIILLCIKN